MHRILGAQQLTFYIMDIDQSIVKYLKTVYKGYIQLIQWTKHLHEKEPIHYYGEILAIHDCMYRNKYSTTYVAFVDLDEALIPRRYKNWRTMLLEIDQPYIDSFVFINSVFIESPSVNASITKSLNKMPKCEQNKYIPHYFRYFDEVKCDFHYFARSKLIVKPNLIFDMSIHEVCTRLGNTTHYFVPRTSALSQHYRTVSYY